MADPADLKSAGLKATLPRLRILEVFEKSEERHLSAEDVFRILLDKGEDIGLATVYRVLTQFEQANLLVRSQFEGSKAVFEMNEGEHHDHLVCLQCGKVVEFVDTVIESRQEEIAKKYGFELADHVMALYANCSNSDCENR